MANVTDFIPFITKIRRHFSSNEILDYMVQRFGLPNQSEDIRIIESYVSSIGREISSIETVSQTFDENIEASWRDNNPDILYYGWISYCAEATVADNVIFINISDILENDIPIVKHRYYAGVDNAYNGVTPKYFFRSISGINKAFGYVYINKINLVPIT